MKVTSSTTKYKCKLMILLLLISETAVAEDNFSLKKSMPGSYTAISIENDKSIQKKSNSALRVRNERLPKVGIFKNPTQKNKIEVVKINSSVASPKVVNNSKAFVFRDITNRNRKLMSGSNIKERTSKIDFLRRQIKER